MINKDGGGQFFDFMGGTAVMRGDIELMGGPPTRETLPMEYVSIHQKAVCILNSPFMFSLSTAQIKICKQRNI